MLSAAFCAVMLAFSQTATALTIGDGQTLGTVTPAHPFGDAFATGYVDHLRQMALNSTDTFDSQTFDRTNNDFGPLPAPVFATKSTGPFPSTGTTTIDLGSGLYSYLFAKYDSQNTFSVVWYVGNLSGLITIPNSNGQYGLSSWILFGPGVPGVPDGGATVMLLGTALGALGIVRRFVMG